MWDESLPAYTGSFEDNVMLGMIYLRYIIFYIVVLLGLISILVALLSPIFVAYFSISSVKIKVKHKKNKEKDNRLKSDENLYLNRLEKNLKKKKKK